MLLYLKLMIRERCHLSCMAAAYLKCAENQSAHVASHGRPCGMIAMRASAAMRQCVMREEDPTRVISVGFLSGRRHEVSCLKAQAIGDLRKALEMQLQLPLGQAGLRFCAETTLESLEAGMPTL